MKLPSEPSTQYHRNHQHQHEQWLQKPLAQWHLMPELDFIFGEDAIPYSDIIDVTIPGAVTRVRIVTNEHILVVLAQFWLDSFSV